MQNNAILVVLLIVGIIADSDLISMAACILLIMKFVRLQRFFPLLERRGLETGLLFLLLAIMVPIASGEITWDSMSATLFTAPGIIAVISGALATSLNSHGISLLQNKPDIIIGLLIGSIGGIVIFGGIPVGPLMAAGLSALLIRLFGFLRPGR